MEKERGGEEDEGGGGGGCPRAEEVPRLLASIYFDPKHPASYGSISRLTEAARRSNNAVKPKQVRQWLSGEDTYTLHRPVRKKFRRRKTIAKGIDHQWQIDLVDMQKLEKFNDRVKYLLTIIDVFSRYAWALPLRNKTGKQVVEALSDLFAGEARQPKLIQSDLGGEFRNAQVLAFLKQRGIKLFSVHSDTKASLVERLNRSLKSRMYRYFTKNNSHRYIDVLAQLVQGYNRAKHRALGTSPDSVNAGNEKAIWLHLYGKEFPTSARFAFEVGDTVRISQIQNIFAKKYTPQWTSEYFRVAKRKATKPPTYKLKDEHGELIDGSFYENQMQRIRRPTKEDTFKVDVLKKRKRKGKTEYFVHYQGWPANFDEWIRDDQLKTL